MGIITHMAPVITVSRLSYNGITQTMQRVHLSIKVCRCRLQPYQRCPVTLISKQLYSTEKVERPPVDKKDAETHGEKISKEIDIARESPYAGLSMGQKGKPV